MKLADILVALKILQGSIAAAASNLTGTTLASNVVTSSLTSVGTLGSLAVGGTLDVRYFLAYVGPTAAASGQGGHIRFRDDTATPRWLMGIPGSAAETGWALYNLVSGVQPVTATNSGNVALGAGSVSTSATDGFPYIPTCAGTPTGTPTAVSGYAPMVVDSTNNKLYVYIGGAWRAMN